VANFIALTVQAYDRNEIISRLSTPVLRIAPRALLVPLVGQMDSTRAEQLEDTLLYGIRDQRARLVVLDLTGAAVFNQRSIERLTEAATAARLLGAEVIMTGVSTRLANSFVQMGMDLGNFRMVGDLQSGIREALHRAGTSASHSS
jgi:rsbT co-antagonist protein RsbR